jgi:type III pantothenate kinase
MSRRMLLDAGNSSLKWALAEGGTWLVRGRCGYDELAALRGQLTAATACFVACVAGAAERERLAGLLDDAGCPTRWLASEARRGDLVNGYDTPHRLGVDRWMGLIAARRRTHEPVLVVSAGTALTVDALAATGVFLGGLIVPGAGLMRAALAQGTAGAAAGPGRYAAFPRNTEDAVHAGVVAALCGAIRAQHARLAALVQVAPRCLLTGGDAALLRPHLELDAALAPELVLEGIDEVARTEVGE